MPTNENPSIFNLNNDNQSDKENGSPLTKWIHSYGASYQKSNQPLNKEKSCDNTQKKRSVEERISRLTASLVYLLQKENIELKQKINILSKTK